MTVQFCASCGWNSLRLKYKRNIPQQELIVRELKRCADEIASTDLSLQTIREMIEAPERAV